eukprot:364081-Chlamydomonas_euryale.AAC.7
MQMVHEFNTSSLENPGQGWAAFPFFNLVFERNCMLRHGFPPTRPWPGGRTARWPGGRTPRRPGGHTTRRPGSRTPRRPGGRTPRRLLLYNIGSHSTSVRLHRATMMLCHASAVAALSSIQLPPKRVPNDCAPACKATALRED